MALKKFKNRADFTRTKKRHNGKFTYEKTSVKGLYVQSPVKIKEEKSALYRLKLPLDVTAKIKDLARKELISDLDWIRRVIMNEIDKQENGFW